MCVCVWSVCRARQYKLLLHVESQLIAGLLLLLLLMMMMMMKMLS